MVVLFATLSLSLLVFATAQEGDVLLLDGKEYVIHTNPLEPFLAKNPGKLPKSNVIISTSNWRGYFATWEVKNDQLLLKDIRILVAKEGGLRSGTERRSVLSQVFPGRSDIFADWFTGNIIIPDGKLVEYVHMGYASTYDSYIILSVEGGVLARRWKANKAAFEEFRDSQFAAFKKTAEYQSALAEATSGTSPLNPREAEEFIRQFYAGKYMSRIFDAPKEPCLSQSLWFQLEGR